MAKTAKGGGQSRKPRPSDGAPPQIGALTDEQRQALHYQHCAQYEAAIATKKKADAAIKNVGKIIKAEGGSVDQVKKTLLARTPEGETELRREMAETLEALRWSGVEVGETAELFPEDRTPSIERARAEGKRAGLAGQPAKPPHDPNTEQYRAWMEGHGEGQTVLAKGFKPIQPTAEMPPTGVPRDVWQQRLRENNNDVDAAIRAHSAATGSIGTASPTHVTQQ